MGKLKTREGSIEPSQNRKSNTSSPKYVSWDDFLDSTTIREIRTWCSRKAGQANKPRLMSGKPTDKITVDTVLNVLLAAKGRCHFCGSLAVENRPSKPNGSPLPWEHIGRRIGGLGHLKNVLRGGTNTEDNLVWSCILCNTFEAPAVRKMNAQDYGAIKPTDETLTISTCHLCGEVKVCHESDGICQTLCIQCLEDEQDAMSEMYEDDRLFSDPYQHTGYDI
jgi:hypothetical protein